MVVIMRHELFTGGGLCRPLPVYPCVCVRILHSNVHAPPDTYVPLRDPDSVSYIN